MQNETIEVNATRAQIESFLESVLWQDIVRELEAWRRGFLIEQSQIVDDAEEKNPSTASVLLHMGDLNGRQKAVDYLIQLPRIFIEVIDERAKEKKLNSKEVSDV